MRIEWDEAKSNSTYRKHGVSFETAQLVFDDPHHLCVQDRQVDREERWQTIGPVGGAVLLLVAHTWRDENGEETVRIISARKATARERQHYEQGD
jgi:uncharacterized DUF497 family protein